MRKAFVLILVCVLTASLTSCIGAAPAGSTSKASLPDQIQNENKTVTLTRVSDRLWVHTTYEKYGGVDTPSNGVLAVSEKGIILVDTPWTMEQTRDLLSLTKKSFNMDCKLAIITHAHQDRIGGIDVLLENNIRTISTSLTAEMAEKQGYKAPEPEIPMDKAVIMDYGGIRVESGYFGEGHSCDNIVVWFPKEKVLFGGCLVKSSSSTDIGNTADANLKQWPATIQAVMEKYKAARLVMPGHGPWGGRELLEHTLELLKNTQQ